MQDLASPFPIGRNEFVVMMAAMMSMNALAIDVMLPALGAMAIDLQVASENSRQYVVSLFILGMGIGAIAYGPLADRYGRRPVLLFTLTGYVICSLLCVIVDDFTQFLVIRFVQGLFSASMFVLANSIVRDRYEGDAMASLMSTISMIFMIVPIIAPSIGQLILAFADWHAIFLLLVVLSSMLWVWIWLRLPETLRRGDRRPISMASLRSGWGQILTNRNALCYVLGSGLVMSALFGFIASAQQVMYEYFGAGTHFGALFACVAGGMAVSNFTNARIVELYGARVVSHFALFAFIGFALINFALMAADMLILPVFIGLLGGSMAMVGFIGANFSSIAMQPFGHIAGTASSVQTFIRTVIAAVAGALIGQQFDGTPMPMIAGFLFCGLAALLILLIGEKGKLLRRHNPPGTPPAPVA
jgi:DHA1 family bicyclomycin/chloramphenicol resistance-like MFS transporter